MAIRKASTDDGYGTRRHEDALRIARIISTCTVERNDKEKTERNWNNKNNFFTFGARQLFLLFSFVSILHEVIIENKLGQFVFDIRKRIGIIGIISSRIGIILFSFVARIIFIILIRFKIIITSCFFPSCLRVP